MSRSNLLFGATTRLPPFIRTSRSFFPSRSFGNSATEEEIYASQLRRYAETSDSNRGRAIHAKSVKGSLPSSLFFRNHLLNMYVKCGDLVDGLQLFEEMPDTNVVSWSAVIAGLVKHGCPNEALSLFRRMRCDGITKPNQFTLVSAVQASSLVENLTEAYKIYAVVVRLGFESNIFLVNAFLTALIRHGELAEALEVFDDCPYKDIVSWNAMMAGFLQFSYMDVPDFWCRMIRDGVKPDHFTFASALTGLAALSDLQLGLQLHAQLVKYGYGVEMCVGNALADMYIKNQKLGEGFKAFNEIPVGDVCSWTQMAAGCLQCGEPSKALEIVAQMKKMGIKPNKFTLATALNACANIASLAEGKKVHGLRIKLGRDIDVCVDNALLDMYAKCGCVDSAWAVFRSMNDHSIVSWTTMIMACAINGQSRKALKIYDEMRLKDIHPNCITFICVLYACGQGGFLDEGRKLFSSMTCDYGILPQEDHYACMVNLLGRAGRLKEAEELILGMPFKPGVLVWKTLLGACHVYGDMEIGKHAAEHVLHLDRNDPSTYVVLSNLFAGLSNWDSVGMLRELMETRDVKKIPGSSWIEVEKNRSLIPKLEGCM